MNFYTTKQKDNYIGYSSQYPGLSYEDTTEVDTLEGIIHLCIIVIEELIVQWAEELKRDTEIGHTLILGINSGRMIELDKLIKQRDDCYCQLGK